MYKYNDREFITRRARVYFRIGYIQYDTCVLIKQGGYFQELVRLNQGLPNCTNEIFYQIVLIFYSDIVIIVPLLIRIIIL